MTMAQIAPNSMKGLRTRAQSDKKPATTRPAESAAAYYTLIPLAWGVERLKVTTQ